MTDKTKEELIEETALLQKRIAELENDVSEKMQVEKELRSKEILLLNLINSTPDFIFVKDTELRNILSNDAYATAIGKSPDELTGHTDIENGWDSELVKGNPAKGIRGFETDDRDALSGTTVHNFSDPANMGSEICYFDTLKLPLYDDDKQIVGMMGIARNVTERKRANEILRKSEAKYRTLVNALEEGVILRNEKGEIVEANASARRIWGMSETELQGHGAFASSWQAVHEDLTPWPANDQPDMTTLRTGQAQSGVVMGVRKSDETLTWLLVNVQPLIRPEDGRPMAVVSSYTDITTLKQVEESLAESNNRLLMTLDAADAVVWFTDVGERLSEIGPVARLFGKPEGFRHTDKAGIYADVYPEDRAVLAAAVQTGAREGSAFSVEFRILLPDGSIRWLQATGRFERDSTGESPRLAGIVRDISHRKEIDRITNEFTSTVSHELRTPLTSILGSLTLLSNQVTGAFSDEGKKLVAVALRNSERLSRLINDILSVEKIEAGKIYCDLKPFEIAPLLEQALAVNRPFADQYHVNLKLTSAPSDYRVTTDSDRFIQIMTNLISNAVKYSPAQSQVEVRAERENSDVRIEVSDHGPGIPENFRERVFTKFAQADSSNARVKGGTGLGLSISKALVESFGGHIGFKTKINEGSTFYFTLPQSLPESTVAGRS